MPIEGAGSIGVREWLGTREPAPPAALADKLARLAGDAKCGTAELSNALLGLAQTLLSSLGSGRDSADDLLAADALITYALEALADDCVAIDAAAGHAMTKIAVFASNDGKAG